MASPRKSPGSDDAKPVQDAPTNPRPTDDNGRVLDEHGLPVNGPARQRALTELGIVDPALKPDEPEPVPTPEPAAPTPSVPSAQEA